MDLVKWCNHQRSLSGLNMLVTALIYFLYFLWCMCILNIYFFVFFFDVFVWYLRSTRIYFVFPLWSYFCLFGTKRLDCCCCSGCTSFRLVLLSWMLLRRQQTYLRSKAKQEHKGPPLLLLGEDDGWLYVSLGNNGMWIIVLHVCSTALQEHIIMFFLLPL
jgi:hypothetical protein